MNNFEKACEMSLNDWLATIPDLVPEAEYTRNHEKWKRKLFNKMRGNRYHMFTTKTIKVMLVAAVLCTLLLTAFVIPSSREYIIDNFEIFSRYKITENNKNSVNNEITVGYIPEGFELESTVIEDKHALYNYISKDNGSFIVSKFSSSIEVDLDTETGNIETINVNGKVYSYSVDENNYNYLVWTENDYVYRINGAISKYELLKIAETVK